MRAALGWALRRGETELALGLVGALWWFWFVVAGVLGDSQQAARLWGAAQALVATGIPGDTDWLAEADARISTVRSNLGKRHGRRRRGEAVA